MMMNISRRNAIMELNNTEIGFSHKTKLSHNLVIRLTIFTYLLPIFMKYVLLH